MACLVFVCFCRFAGGTSLSCTCDASQVASSDAVVQSGGHTINITAAFTASPGLTHQQAGLVLRSLRYTPRAERPDTLLTTRIVRVSVSDGAFVTSSLSNITVDLNNQPPGLDLNGAQVSSFVKLQSSVHQCGRQAATK